MARLDEKVSNLLELGKNVFSNIFSDETLDLTNEKIKTRLQEIGLASQEEVNALRKKIDRLEYELSELKKSKRKNPKKTGKSPKIKKASRKAKPTLHS